jgi:hypothetical protein
LYLDDILEAIGNIREYTAGMDYATFQRDNKTRDAELCVIWKLSVRQPDVCQNTFTMLLLKSNYEGSGISNRTVRDIIAETKDHV